MAAGLCAQQMRVTFEDIAVSFSQEEWEYLDEEQKELYREVMKENYQTLISLGAGSLTFTPEIISHIERGEEPYSRDEPGSGEREPGKSRCSDHQITQERKIKKNPGDHHRNDELFTSTECNQSFTLLSTLKSHQMTHTGDQSFLCSECNKSFTWLSNLKTATKKIHMGDKPFPCTECHKSFTHVSTLKTHQMIHSGDKPFSCSECHKSFNLFSALKRHQKIHTGVRPFSCSDCHKSFIQLSSLKRHQIIHTETNHFHVVSVIKSFNMLSTLKCPTKGSTLERNHSHVVMS
ncbi:gastrula zinc finger protein XlCGF7.1-like isoform X2 [Microcaecilia unicolor]|uniref:Gastrula zinc finger protein XlCGF7.1-like isoform X2 n=1 Tax=Microcaecilia unicolor TaxID=1415580 RepID=A0A6P7XJB1_9AMPH|nr:gastrula zinc finger protein XlCGF7.1-like isoform X2 [Microcaecilia unicolor]